MQGLQLDVYGNSALVGNASSSANILTRPSDVFNLSFSALSSPFSSEALGVLSYPSDGAYSFSCDFAGLDLAFVWLNDHQICNFGAYYNSNSSIDGTSVYPLIGRKDKQDVIRVHAYYSNSSSTPFVALNWNATGATLSPIPATSLAPTVPPLEKQRLELQRAMLRGWAPWIPHNLMAMVALPQAARITTAMCEISTGSCLTASVGADDRNSNVRVGLHALDRSYGQYYINAFQSPPNGLNVSIEWSATGAQDLRLKIHPISCPNKNCSDYAIAFGADFAWYRSGEVTIDPSSSLISFAAYGLERIDLHASAAGLPSVALDKFHPPSSPLSSKFLALPLAHGPLTLSTHPSEDESAVSAVLAKAKAAEEAQIMDKYGSGQSAELATACQAAVMWNLVWLPAEQGPVLPVDRSWDLSKGPLTPDWSYTMFQWDNHFASYIAMHMLDTGTTAMRIAISNVIQTVRSTKTAKGFGSNYASGGSKSVDRTEPPQAARVLLALYERYRACCGADLLWVVSLLFDDLLDWHRWFLEARVLAPAGLICLGSNAVPGFHDYAPNTIAAARMESGLDNSPMYDCGDNWGISCDELFHAETGQMQLYDIGMSSMYVSETDCLAKLAGYLGRDRAADAARLKADADEMRTLIASQLWDEQSGIFANRFPNGSFYRRISPTSFYPLMANASSDAQAASMMVNWAMNKSRFALTPAGDFDGNNEDNYWGLPSISAHDAAFPKLGYWRGYVWGPMVQLVHWGMANYDHVQEVRTARKALAKQMSQLTLSQWRMNRFICENFSPKKTAVSCTGTKFYHWGALGALVELTEAGLYSYAHVTNAI